MPEYWFSQTGIILNKDRIFDFALIRRESMDMKKPVLSDSLGSVARDFIIFLRYYQGV